MGALGRVAGITGIFGPLLGRWTPDNAWRALFILGLLAGTILTALLGGFDSDSMAFPGNPLTTVVGGFLVGIGTVLGGGLHLGPRHLRPRAACRCAAWCRRRSSCSSRWPPSSCMRHVIGA